MLRAAPGPHPCPSGPDVGKSPCLRFWVLRTCPFITHDAEPLRGRSWGGSAAPHCGRGAHWRVLQRRLWADKGGAAAQGAAREHQAALTDLVVAVHQDDAKVGGLEPPPTLHDHIVALADVVDVHGDAGVRSCNAQQGPSVPQPATRPIGLWAPRHPHLSRALVLSQHCARHRTTCHSRMEGAPGSSGSTASWAGNPQAWVPGGCTHRCHASP